MTWRRLFGSARWERSPTPPSAVPVSYDYPPCPVCGYRGPAARVPKGSMLIAVSLLLIGVLPGLIYLMFFSGDVWTCWQCGATKADA